MALGASFLVIDAMRRRREERALVGALDRRFRAMVEGSLDVITVVSGLDEVTVMSPTLGPLRDIVTAASPRRVSEIVPDEMMSRWREVDDQIREGGGHRRMAPASGTAS